MSRNPITGDAIRTKGVLSEEGRSNYDRIFGKKHPNPIQEALEVKCAEVMMREFMTAEKEEDQKHD